MMVLNNHTETKSFKFKPSGTNSLNIRLASLNSQKFIINLIEKSFYSAKHVTKQKQSILGLKNYRNEQKLIQDYPVVVNLNDFNLTRTQSVSIGDFICVPMLKYIGKKFKYNYCILKKTLLKESAEGYLGCNFHSILHNADNIGNFRLFFNFRGKIACIGQGEPKIFKYYLDIGEVSRNQFLTKYKQLHVPSVRHSSHVAINKICQLRHYTINAQLDTFLTVDINLGVEKSVEYTSDELIHFAQVLTTDKACYNSFLTSRNQKEIPEVVGGVSVSDLLSISHDVSKPSTFFIGVDKGYVSYTSNHKSVNTDFYYIDENGSFIDPVRFFQKYSKSNKQYNKALNVKCHDVKITDFYNLIMSELKVTMSDILSCHTYKQNPVKASSYNAMKVVLNHFYKENNLNLKVIKVGKRKYNNLIKKLKDKIKDQKIILDHLTIGDKVNIAKINRYRESVNELLKNNFQFSIKKELVVEPSHLIPTIEIKEVYERNSNYISDLNVQLKGKTTNKDRHKFVKKVEEILNTERLNSINSKVERLISRFDIPLEPQPVFIKKIQQQSWITVPEKTIKPWHLPTKVKEEFIFTMRNRYEKLYLNDEDQPFDFNLTDEGLVYFLNGERKVVDVSNKRNTLEPKLRNNNRNKTKQQKEIRKNLNKYNKYDLSKTDVNPTNRVALKDTVDKMNLLYNIINHEKGKIQLKDLRMHLSKKETGLSKRSRDNFLKTFGLPKITKCYFSRFDKFMLKKSFCEKRLAYDQFIEEIENKKKEKEKLLKDQLYMSNLNTRRGVLIVSLKSFFKKRKEEREKIRKMIEDVELAKLRNLKLKWLIDDSIKKIVKFFKFAHFSNKIKERIETKKLAKIKQSRILLGMFIYKKILNKRLLNRVKELCENSLERKKAIEERAKIHVVKSKFFERKRRKVNRLASEIFNKIGNNWKHPHMIIVQRANLKEPDLTEEELDLILSLYG